MNFIPCNMFLAFEWAADAPRARLEAVGGVEEAISQEVKNAVRPLAPIFCR